MKVPTIQTERLDLCEPRRQDVPEIVRLANDFDVARHLARLPHPYGPDDALFFLDNVVTSEPTWRIARRCDEALMGFVGLKPVDDEVLELGYWLGHRYWGAGFATEAAAGVVSYAFENLGMDRIISGYFAANTASGRVLEKLGFVEVGQSQRFGLAMGSDLPHVDVEMTRDEWDAARNRG